MGGRTWMSALTKNNTGAIKFDEEYHEIEETMEVEGTMENGLLQNDRGHIMNASDTKQPLQETQDQVSYQPNFDSNVELEHEELNEKVLKLLQRTTDIQGSDDDEKDSDSDEIVQYS